MPKSKFTTHITFITQGVNAIKYFMLVTECVA